MDTTATEPAVKPAVLIVEDEAGPRDALKVILRPFFTIHAAESGRAALRVLREESIDLITLDQKLPDCQGIELLQQIKLEHPNIEVIIITGYGSLKSAMDGIRLGAAGYLLKPFNVTELISLTNQTLEKKKRLESLRQFLRTQTGLWGSEQDADSVWKQLIDQYRPQTARVSDAGTSADPGSQLIPLFMDLFEARDRRLLNHAASTSSYAKLIAERLSLDDERRRCLALGAFLHDVGYLSFADQDVAGSEQAPAEQREVLKRHPEVGARVTLLLGFPGEVSQIISYHHERHDGNGYPYGLQGEGIPLLARIVAIAEAFDNLLTGRHHAAPHSVDKAIARIEGAAGTEFDPDLVSAFSHVMREHKASLPVLGISPNQAAL